MSEPPPPGELLAQAAARRCAGKQTTKRDSLLPDQEYERRQAFRRLIDPGIFRPNSKEVAMDSLKILSAIADNILREPENQKFQTLKAENDTIKRRLIQPKGALEYALALGFRPKVVDFQSHYVFHPSMMADLRIGAAILKEALDRETEKEERLHRSRAEKKAADAVIAQNIKLAFLDDRKRKMVRDQRERELRGIRQSQSALASSPLPPVEGASPIMPGPGHTLAAVNDEHAGMD